MLLKVCDTCVLPCLSIYDMRNAAQIYSSLATAWHDKYRLKFVALVFQHAHIMLNKTNIAQMYSCLAILSTNNSILCFFIQALGVKTTYLFIDQWSRRNFLQFQVLHEHINKPKSSFWFQATIQQNQAY